MYRALLCAGLWLTLSLLTHAGARASPGDDLIGCWDNDSGGATHKALCFFSDRFEWREGGAFDTGWVSWTGSYRVSETGDSFEFSSRGAPDLQGTCRLSVPSQRVTYFDKVAGRRITKNWPLLRLGDCDLAGDWPKACDKFEVSYGTCPRNELPTGQ